MGRTAACIMATARNECLAGTSFAKYQIGKIIKSHLFVISFIVSSIITVNQKTFYEFRESHYFITSPSIKPFFWH